MGLAWTMHGIAWDLSTGIHDYIIHYISLQSSDEDSHFRSCGTHYEDESVLWSTKSFAPTNLSLSAPEIQQFVHTIACLNLDYSDGTYKNVS